MHGEGSTCGGGLRAGAKKVVRLRGATRRSGYETGFCKCHST